LYSFVKITFDYLFAIFLIVFLFPLFLIIILSLLLFSNSNIFFIHKRIGKSGKEFNLYKFRTMKHSRDKILSKYFRKYPNEEKYWQENQKLKNDPRVTKVGYFLREYSLDELPQILNVLKGEMSFVGPRPIVEDEKDKYGDRFSYYKQVKPGLSGLWQVSGRNNTTYSQRVEFDYLYTQEISFFLDLKIFFKTIYVILIRKGAY
jgi:undecaprenyl-phosphate galactose phosphotransferase